MGMSIQGGVAVVRPGAKAPSNRVVSPYWSSPVPNAGSWCGYSPAGCEVCRERPAVSRAQPWTKTESRDPLTHGRNRNEKLACEIPLHVGPNTARLAEATDFNEDGKDIPYEEIEPAIRELCHAVNEF